MCLTPWSCSIRTKASAPESWFIRSGSSMWRTDINAAACSQYKLVYNRVPVVVGRTLPRPRRDGQPLRACLRTAQGDGRHLSVPAGRTPCGTGPCDAPQGQPYAHPRGAPPAGDRRFPYLYAQSRVPVPPARREGGLRPLRAAAFARIDRGPARGRPRERGGTRGARALRRAQQGGFRKDHGDGAGATRRGISRAHRGTVAQRRASPRAPEHHARIRFCRWIDMENGRRSATQKEHAEILAGLRKRDRERCRAAISHISSAVSTRSST